MIYIIGMAHTNTSEMIYESFLLSPLITPAVAIAAETPQIDTELANLEVEIKAAEAVLEQVELSWGYICWDFY